MYHAVPDFRGWRKKSHTWWPLVRSCPEHHGHRSPWWTRSGRYRDLNCWVSPCFTMFHHGSFPLEIGFWMGPVFDGNLRNLSFDAWKGIVPCKCPQPEFLNPGHENFVNFCAWLWLYLWNTVTLGLFSTHFETSDLKFIRFSSFLDPHGKTVI